MNLTNLWDSLVDCVCRPPRDEYIEEELIGGTSCRFLIGSRNYYRQDVVLENSRGMKLQGSHFKPCLVPTMNGKLPAVVYCHCNSGSRRDAEEAVYLLLPHNITVFCLDFAGSGMSQGDWVTLGAHEVDDLAVAVEYVRSEGSSSFVGLWGRSMGAVTALLYSNRDPSIAGMVLDSPFSRLTDLMMELVEEQRLRVPRALMKVALGMMRRSVKKRAGFKIDDVAPLDTVGESFIPALFGHADGDTFIAKHHSERLHGPYAGDKNLVTFEGDHNSMRPPFFYHSVLFFFKTVLQLDSMQLLPHLRHLAPSITDLRANGVANGAPNGMSVQDDAQSSSSDDAAAEGESTADARSLQRRRSGSHARYLAAVSAGGAPASPSRDAFLPSAHGSGSNDMRWLDSTGDDEALQEALMLSLAQREVEGSEAGELTMLAEEEETAMLEQAIRESLLDQQLQQRAGPRSGWDHGLTSPPPGPATRDSAAASQPDQSPVSPPGELLSFRAQPVPSTSAGGSVPMQCPPSAPAAGSTGSVGDGGDGLCPFSPSTRAPDTGPRPAAASGLAAPPAPLQIPTGFHGSMADMEDEDEDERMSGGLVGIYTPASSEMLRDLGGSQHGREEVLQVLGAGLGTLGLDSQPDSPAACPVATPMRTIEQHRALAQHSGTVMLTAHYNQQQEKEDRAGSGGTL